MNHKLFVCLILFFALSGWISGCGNATETLPSVTQLFPAYTATQSVTATPTPASVSLPGTRTPTLIQASASPTAPEPTKDETSTTPGDYPAPPDQTLPLSGAYPAPQDQNPPSSDVYPAPPQGEGVGAGLTSTPTNTPKLTQSPASTGTTPTPGATPTERMPQPFGLNVTPSAGKVSIYHSWQTDRLDALMQIIQGFQKYFPEVVFDLTYVPEADLLGRYTQAAYNGGGPDLLLGSSDWRASLSKQELVEDLSPYISASFRETLNPVALETGQFQGPQICLPYEQHGVVLYRNARIIPTASATFEQLVSAARKATGVGTIGVYFEGGSYFSLAHLFGLGGQLLDDQGKPLFDRDHYQVALAWIGLLKEMQQAGALELNGDRDMQLFEESKSGLLVEGSWNRNALAQAVGAKNLVIDPWPSYQSGSLSGFVQSDCVYLNANTRELSALDHQAALNFIGYFLTPPTQERLADTGLIPVLRDASPTDPLIRQAMLAFQGGTPYPVELDDVTRQVYFTALDGAVAAVINQGRDPLIALQTAFDAIQTRLIEIHTEEP